MHIAFAVYRRLSLITSVPHSAAVESHHLCLNLSMVKVWCLTLAIKASLALFFLTCSSP